MQYHLMKVNIYTLDVNFTAKNQMYLLAKALKRKGINSTIYPIFNFHKNKPDEINIFFPFHYHHPFPTGRQKINGIYISKKLYPFYKNDIPIGFADSSLFATEVLEDIRSYNYSYFGALSKDTAEVMSLPKTEVIYGCYDPYILGLRHKKQDIPVIYVNATNFYYRRGYDIALRALERLSSEENFKVIIRDWNNPPLPENLKSITTVVSGVLTKEKHYEALNKADIVFSPNRGGALELQILESLVLGKTIIIPNKGGVSELPDKDDVYWIDTLNRDFPIIGTDYTEQAYHLGYMYSLDEDSAYSQLKKAIKHPKKYDIRKYISRYSPEAYAKRIIEFYNKHS